MRAAPTGVAAHGINGKTLHSLLKLPLDKRSFGPLTGVARATLQVEMDGVEFLVIDEKSMIGLTMLAWVDNRLELRPSNQESMFGGLNVILVGDFAQLPPVMAKPLYYADPLSDPFEIAGSNAYFAFNKTIRLTTVMRQQGDAQAAFRTALGNLRENTITEVD